MIILAKTSNDNHKENNDYGALKDGLDCTAHLFNVINLMSEHDAVCMLEFIATCTDKTIQNFKQRKGL